MFIVQMALCRDPSSQVHEHMANEVYTKQKDTYLMVCVDQTKFHARVHFNRPLELIHHN